MNIKVYDTIIIGGGLSGLAAAQALKDYNVLVLEKTGQFGGRVQTRKQNGAAYDLGGLFTPPKDLLPKALQLQLQAVSFDSTIGLHYKDSVYWGKKVTDCLNAVQLSKAEKKEIRQFFQEKDLSADHLSEKTFSILNAFFQLIHPAPINHYRTERKYDALVKWQLSYLTHGNRVVIDYLTDNCKADLLIEAEVQHISDETERVKVTYQKHGQTFEAIGKKVLVTTPAPITAQLLNQKNSATEAFLNRLKYHEGFTLSLGVPKQLLKSFGFVVTPHLKFTSVLQQQRANDLSVLTIYFTGAFANSVRLMSLENLVHETLIDLQWAANANIKLTDLIFYDGQYWPYISPEINEAYDFWNVRSLRPSPNVYLAGDYTWYDATDPLPYGMGAAYLSGLSAGKRIQSALPNKQVTFQGKHLLHTQIYRMDANRPVFLGQTKEGDIAYYGILLGAHKEEDLKQYLLDCAKDGMWEYQEDFGITLDDSLLVIEGLWRAGWEEEEFRYSLEQLIHYFYDQDLGAFHTLSPRPAQRLVLAGGRSKYWKGPCTEGTAQMGWLLSQSEKGDYSEIIARCQAYLGQHQHPLGFWASKWFPSYMWGTYYGLALLLQNPNQFTSNINKARRFLINSQQENGSWQDSVLETSFAVRALKILNYDEQHDYVKAGIDWLHTRLEKGQLTSESLLYYWFEEPDGTKLFHEACDGGSIAQALVKLALEEKPIVTKHLMAKEW